MRTIDNVNEIEIFRDRFIDRLELHLKSYDMSDFRLLIERDNGISLEMQGKDPTELVSYIMDIGKGFTVASLRILGPNGGHVTVYSKSILIA